MPSSEKNHNFKEIPKQLATESQLWDEILKKEIYLMPEQIFPLIKEIYGISYPPNTPIQPIATEYSIERSDTKEITSLRADITLNINAHDIYHFECESKFPFSAVLFLQDNKNIPDTLFCKIHFQNGSILDYAVPAVKVQNYSLSEIKEKHLNLLIPFLPLRFQKFFRSPKRKQNFSIERLTSFYQQIILILEEEVTNHYISENNRNVIINLLHKSFIHVFFKDKKLLKEVIAMTAPVLELEIEKYIYAVEERDHKLALMQNKLNQKENELSKKDNELSKKDNEIDLLKKQLAALQKQL